MEYNFGNRAVMAEIVGWSTRLTKLWKNNSKEKFYRAQHVSLTPVVQGLHVGHPLGYIASDIYARYNVCKDSTY